MSLSECSCVSGSECTSVYECEMGVREWDCVSLCVCEGEL